jgi:hypothetical protein
MKQTMLVVLLMASGQVWAAYQSGNDLLRQCKAGDVNRIVGCYGYIASVVDTHEALVARGMQPEICVPEEIVSPERLRRIVLQYFAGNPESLHFAASSLILNALRGAFPCRK